MTTPNMGLPVPSPQVTPGPTWAQDVNDCFDEVDSHDHSTGRGARITPAGISINSTLEMNENDLSEVNSVLLVDRSADISLTRGLYVKNGEFFYKDASGNAVQLTSGGSIAGTTGSFTGLSSPAAATYSSSNKRFTWTYDSSKFARMAQADLDLYPYDASTAYTKAITLKAPTGLEATASYSLTLPTALPAAAELMTVDNAGLIDHASISGTSNQIAVSSSATAVTLSLPSTVATSIFQAGAGTVSAPSISFSADPNTGLFNLSADVVRFAAGGATAGGFTSAGLVAANGTGAAPGYTFVSDSALGMYRAASNQLGFAVAGSSVATMTASGLAVTGAVSSTSSATVGTSLAVGTSLSVGTTAVITGALTAASLNLNGGGAYKTTVYTGTLTAVNDIDLSPGGTIYGYSGVSSYGGGSFYYPIMGRTGASTTTDVIGVPLGSGSSSTVRLFNYDSDSTNTYRIIIFHA